MRKTRITLVASQHVAALARETIREIHDDTLEIRILQTSMEDFYSSVNACNLDEIDIFVSSGIYAQMLQGAYPKPVVAIHKTSMDFLMTVLKASKTGKKIAVTSFKEEPPIDFEAVRMISGADLTPVIFSDIAELKEILKTSDFDTVIGSGLSTEAAEEFGIDHYLVYNGKSSVIEAIYNAKNIFQSVSERSRRKSILDSIFNFNNSCLIITDQSGIIENINPAAEILLRAKSEAVKGKAYSALFPDVDLDPVISGQRSQMTAEYKAGSRVLHLHIVSIEDGNETVGFLITVEPPAVNKTQPADGSSKEAAAFRAKNTFSDIVGNSYSLKEQIEKAKKYARTDANILITGETGVGKEIFAQSIHNYSYRYKHAFVAVNCAAIPSSILESELFGYEEGAFTGSRKGGKKGLFEMADNGTIFLDEIGELPYQLQSRLLRVLQEKEIMRLGGERSIPINVRIICATNRNLEKMIPDQFREDLFYRISVLRIDLPPLRNRGDDVIDLFRILLSRQYINSDRLDNDMMQILKLYSWPGNIREMQNVIARFAVEINGMPDITTRSVQHLLVGSIGEKRLVSEILKKNGIEDPAQIKNKQITAKLLSELSEIYPRQNEKIAELLGISRTTLWRKLSSES